MKSSDLCVIRLRDALEEEDHPFRAKKVSNFILWYDIPGGNVIYAIIAMAFLKSIYYLFNLNKQFTNN